MGGDVYMEGTLFWEYRYLILVGLIIFLIYQYEWQRAKAILYALMFQARRYSQKELLLSGKEQEDWVVVKSIKLLPWSIRIFMNQNIIRYVIHDMYQNLDVYSIEDI